MQRRSLVPDVITYNAVIGACDKGHEPQQALHLLKALQRRGKSGRDLAKKLEDTVQDRFAAAPHGVPGPGTPCRTDPGRSGPVQGASGQSG